MNTIKKLHENGKDYWSHYSNSMPNPIARWAPILFVVTLLTIIFS